MHGWIRRIALISAILFAFAPAASAQLRVAEGAPRAALFRSLYDRLPQGWKARHVVEVQEVADWEMDEIVGPNQHQDDGSIVDGYYQAPRGRSEGPVITLRRTIRDSVIDLIFLHEYAHYIWDHRLVESQRAEYRRIWARGERDGRLVTGYAFDSAEEGFAEAIAHYLRRPAILQRRDRDSWTFIKTLAERAAREPGR